MYCVTTCECKSVFFFKQDFHIHAYVYPDHWKNHAEKIVDGGVYVFSNFYTKKALGTLKSVPSRYLINFSPISVVNSVEDDMMISISWYPVWVCGMSDLFGIAQANGNAEFPEFATSS